MLLERPRYLSIATCDYAHMYPFSHILILGIFGIVAAVLFVGLSLLAFFLAAHVLHCFQCLFFSFISWLFFILDFLSSSLPILLTIKLEVISTSH